MDDTRLHGEDDHVYRGTRGAWLGTQGWELVNAVQVLDDENFPVTTGYFKRPLSELAVIAPSKR